jgi:zinc protease
VVTSLQDQDDLHELNSYENNLEKVSPASLKMMAGKYLSGNNFIKMVLLPEK